MGNQFDIKVVGYEAVSAVTADAALEKFEVMMRDGYKVSDLRWKHFCLATDDKVTARMEWVDAEGRHTTGERLWLGKWPVGSAHYSVGTARGSNLRYAATCRLPGIKTELGNFVSMEQAKEQVERAVNHWLSNLQTTGAGR